MDWLPQVHQPTARDMGLRPEDLDYLRWPLKGVELRHPFIDEPARAVLIYGCSFAVCPPLDNQYEQVEPGTGDSGKDREYRRLPDPVGLTLARVRFELRECETNDILDVSAGLPTPEGEVLDIDPAESAQTWTRLTPGRSIRVQLTARPLFYWLDEHGGAHLMAAGGHRGHFTGKAVRSPEYVLSMSDDPDTYGAVFVDGQPRPKRPVNEGIDQASIDEYNRLVAAEEAERKRLEKEQEDRLAREEREREARWAREDKEREAQRKREEERAAAERKRNEPYVQRHTVDPSKYDMLTQHMDTHLSWIGCPDEEKISFLQQVTGMGDDWKAAAEQIAGENGWTL